MRTRIGSASPACGGGTRSTSPAFVRLASPVSYRRRKRPSHRLRARSSRCLRGAAPQGARQRQRTPRRVLRAGSSAGTACSFAIAATPASRVERSGRRVRRISRSGAPQSRQSRRQRPRFSLHSTSCAPGRRGRGSGQTSCRSRVADERPPAPAAPWRADPSRPRSVASAPAMLKDWCRAKRRPAGRVFRNTHSRMHS